MYLIQLHQLNFFSFHGLYEEEKIIGNNFEVNVDIELTQDVRINTIDDTINYELVFQIIKSKMQIPTPLLESVAQHIQNEIIQQFYSVNKITVNIKKLNPPIEQFNGEVSITLIKNFN
jgi:dihydroneopterin aldolase